MSEQAIERPGGTPPAEADLAATRMRQEAAQEARANSDLDRADQLRVLSTKRALTVDESAEYAGKHEFPGNQHLQDLVKKQLKGAITDGENGELQGKREFPQNQRGQRLVVQDYLHNLSPEENVELEQLRRSRNSQVATVHSDRVPAPCKTSAEVLAEARAEFPRNEEAQKLKILDLTDGLNGHQQAQLKAYEEFPDDPAGQALMLTTSEGKLAPGNSEALAQRIALKDFPDDPRAQELEFKDASGQQLSNEESEELYFRRFYKGQDELIQLKMQLSRGQLELSPEGLQQMQTAEAALAAKKDFPDNPRAQSLQAKATMATATGAEMDELARYQATKDAEKYYPDDLHAQELYIRQSAGAASEAEIKELNEIRNRRADPGSGCPVN